MIRWLRAPEVIGIPECPLMHRWTLHAGARCCIMAKSHGRARRLG